MQCVQSKDMEGRAGMVPACCRVWSTHCTLRWAATPVATASARWGQRPQGKRHEEGKEFGSLAVGGILQPSVQFLSEVFRGLCSAAQESTAAVTSTLQPGKPPAGHPAAGPGLLLHEKKLLKPSSSAMPLAPCDFKRFKCGKSTFQRPSFSSSLDDFEETTKQRS